MIRVRMAETGDRDALISFIRDHWSETHIFVQHPELFSWQHQQDDGRLNMVMAEDVDGDASEVLGILGFIPTGRFDGSLGDRDLTLAIWKVRDDGAPPGIGLRLLKYLQSELRPRLVAAIGTSQMVRRIYELLKYDVGEMHQAALFHPDRRRRFVIAAGVDDLPTTRTVGSAPAVDLIGVDGSPDEETRRIIDRIGGLNTPAKSYAYVRQRFVEHPWYRYTVRLVLHAGDPVAVVVWRSVEAEGARVLRIVDIIGDTDWLGDAQAALEAEVVTADAEYIDVVQWGIDGAVLELGGFVDADAHPGLVIPNYFAPFERRNVKIEMAVRLFGGDGRVCLFRADSDQDRPNLPSELAVGPG